MLPIECDKCNLKTTWSSRICSICNREFGCSGFEFAISDKDHRTFMEYKAVCPTCAAAIMQAIVKREPSNCRGCSENKEECHE